MGRHSFLLLRHCEATTLRHYEAPSSSLRGLEQAVAISLRHCEEGVPDAVISLSHSVILSETKDLEGCTTFHRLADLEILHFVQNDILVVILSETKDLLAILCHPE